MNRLLKCGKHFASISTGFIAISLAFANSARAADFSFRGTFSSDDDVQLLDFTVGTTSTVTLKSLSYAGGIQADGTVIPSGGFDPILAVFDGDGNLISDNDDGAFPDVGIDPVTGAAFDTFLPLDLTPGNYTVAVSQFDNFFNGIIGDNISAGFIREGEPTFTVGFAGCSNGQFCDVFADNRTNEWAFDVLNADTAVVVGVGDPPVFDSETTPESSTLLGLGSLLILGLRKRKES